MTRYFPWALALLALFLLNGNRARADTLYSDGDLEASGGDGCDTTGLPTNIFPPFSANSTGGGCLAFQNLSGKSFPNLRFTTAFTHPDTFVCSGFDLFTTCGFLIDANPFLFPSGTFISSAVNLTIVFTGQDPTHLGIPDGGVFDINLNGPCPMAGCDHFSHLGTGGWLVGTGATATPSSFTGASIPEPESWTLLLCGAGVLLARMRPRNTRPTRPTEPRA